jgi:crotonobetainyl-CoA:carnitine CoA-transferase CaiB-like acyl-CoA transferase
VILLAVGNDKQFARLCQALEVPELAKDARFVTNPARVLHRQVLHPILLERFQHYQRDPLLAQLQQLGVPAGAVHNIPEALAQPEAQALLLSADGLKGLRTFACEGVPAQSLTPPPACGAHTVQILQDWLQLTDLEIRQLQHSQVIA